jgi:hypothetical protein
MTEMENDTREKLREIAGELDALQVRLRELALRLTAPPRPRPDETEDALDVTLDAATELRAVIECVLIDRIQPALRDLRRVVRG